MFGFFKAVFWLTVVSAVLIAPHAWAKDWTSSRSDRGNLGATNEDFTLPTAEGWKVETGSKITCNPAVYDGRVYVGNNKGELYCFDALTGDVLWTFEAQREIDSSPAVSKGRVYFGSRDGYLYALNARTGVLIWKTFHGGCQLSSPLVANDRIFIGIGAPSNEIRAFDERYGVQLWSFDTGQIVYATFAYGDGKIFCGSGNGKIYALDTLSGEKVWEVETNGFIYRTTILYSDGKVIAFPGGYDKDVYILDASTGDEVSKLKAKAKFGKYKTGYGGPPTLRYKEDQPEVDSNWLQEISKYDEETRLELIEIEEKDSGKDLTYLKWVYCPTAYKKQLKTKPGTTVQEPKYKFYSYGFIKICSPAVEGNTVYIMQRLNGYPSPLYTLAAIDMDTGNTNWYYDEQVAVQYGSIASSPAVSKSGILYSGVGKNFYTFSTTGDGKPTSTNTLDEEIIGSPALANGMVYITTKKGTVYAFKTSNTPPSAPASLSPTGGTSITDTTPLLTWNASTDQEDASSALKYIIQIDYDGELDEDVAVEYTTSDGVTQYQFSTNLPSNCHVYFRVRAVDTSGAYSAWSTVSDFYINRDTSVPEPPSNLNAIAVDGGVYLSWDPSPSEDIAGYNLTYKIEDGSYEPAWSVGNTTNYQVSGLTNYKKYTFLLTAVDEGDNESEGITVSATPVPSIRVNNCGSFSSIQNAINNANAGDTVNLGIGTFVEQVDITKKNITIQGYAPGYTLFDGTGLSEAIVVNSDQDAESPVVISNITVTGSSIGIHIKKGFVEVHNCVFAKVGTGVKVEDPCRVILKNLTISNNSSHGIHVDTASEVKVRNCIIVQNDGVGIKSNVGTAYSNFNNLQGNKSGNFDGAAVKGENDITVVINFKSKAQLNYHVYDGAPTVDKGDPNDDYSKEPEPNGKRVNLGAYGNTKYAAKSKAGASAATSAVESVVKKAGGSSSLSGCFIATVAFGSYEEKHVIEYRKFRDRFLSANSLGRSIIGLYYNTSPQVADYIKDKETLRLIVRRELAEVLEY